MLSVFTSRTSAMIAIAARSQQRLCEPLLKHLWQIECKIHNESSNVRQRQNPSSSQKTLSKVSEGQGQVTLGEQVKQTTKDVYYTGIIIAGVGITGVICYYIFRELFSSQSPNGVYTDAFKQCLESPKVVDAVGEPMRGYGELSSRGRRRHVSHMEYIQDDVKCMRMTFYIEGSRRKGTVHLVVQQNERGKYEYRYLFVELHGYPTEVIILKDNR